MSERSALPLLTARRSIIAAGLLGLVALAAGTFAGLHGSSIGIWNSAFPGQPPRAGVLAGTPRFIRIDEWSVVTPAILSQLNQSPPCPVDNPAWGPERTPLLMNVPVRHWSAAFRPQFWGFFLFGPEHGFAFYWMMKAILLSGGCFALLLALTGRPAAAAIGSAWIAGSAFIQWWFSSPSALPEMLGSWALATAGLILATHAARPRDRVVAAAIAAAAGVSFALCCYPPFQIPLVWLSVALLAGGRPPHLGPAPAGARRWRWWPAAAAVAAAGAIAAIYFAEAAPALELVRRTVYPGSRLSTGGELGLAEAFRGLYDVWTSERSFPVSYGNICEASSFALLFPVALAALAWDALRRRAVRPLEAALAVYTLALLAWLVLGWPAPLARLTGLARVPPARAMLGLGVASIIWCIVCAAGRRDGRAAGPAVAAGLALGAAALAAGLALRATAPELVTPLRLAAVTAAAAAAGCAIWSGRLTVLAACAVAPTLLAHAGVNPVARGLAPLTASRLHREVRELVAREPAARWAVFGNYLFANYLKAAGARVMNGTRFVPDPEQMRVLDPADRSQGIHNRYGHMSLATGDAASARFELAAFDSYVATVSATSGVWKALGVRYLVLPAPSGTPDFLRAAQPALQFPELDLWVYRLSGDATP